MSDLTDIFSSKASVKVLRFLSFQSQPVPLRHISDLTDLPVYSVQHCLRALLIEEFITEKKKGQYRLFSLNQKHKSYDFLIDVFRLETSYRIRSFSKTNQKTASKVMELCDSTWKILKKAKKV